jgi:hypothetical protein
MRDTMTMLAAAACVLGLGVVTAGCDDYEDTVDCEAVAEGLAVCVDDFCNGEGAGTAVCECWWIGGDMDPPACVCHALDPIAAFEQACEDGIMTVEDCNLVVPGVRRVANECL